MNKIIIDDEKKELRRLTIGLSIIAIILVGVALFARSTKANEQLEENEEIQDEIQYTVKIYLNGATHVDNNKLTCQTTDGKCNVTLPNASRENGEIIGYSTDYKAKDAKYLPNTDITINSDMELYVISKSTVTIHIDEKKINYLEKNDLSCEIYNSEMCIVQLPNFSIAGHLNLGYTSKEGSYSLIGIPGGYYEFNHNTTIYPIIDNDLYISYDSKTILFNQRVPIDIEKGCNDTQKNILINYLNRINNNIPSLINNMEYGKIGFVKKDTLAKYSLEANAVTNPSNYFLPSIIYNCEFNKSNDELYDTIVHELFHVADTSNSLKNNENLNNRDDIKKIHNSYKEEINNYLKSNPNDSELKNFRNSKYLQPTTIVKNIQEYFAYNMAAYYLKYIDPISFYQSYTFTDDEKKVFEKLYCIIKNNYDESKCN